MKTLQDIINRYKDSSVVNGPFYLAGSDRPYHINRYPGEFIVCKDGLAECFCCAENVPKGATIIKDDGLRLAGFVKYVGVRLDQYYLHPYYPDKPIQAFQICKDIPFMVKGEIHPVVNGNILDSLNYTVENCLEYPEFFKPLY